MSTEDIRQKVQQCVAKMPQLRNVRKISLFGSYLHGDEKSDSDIDLLIELREPVGYFDLVTIQDALSISLQKKVDLVTPKALSKYFRDEVLKEAHVLYEE